MLYKQCIQGVGFVNNKQEAKWQHCSPEQQLPDQIDIPVSNSKSCILIIKYSRYCSKKLLTNLYSYIFMLNIQLLLLFQYLFPFNPSIPSVPILLQRIMIWTNFNPHNLRFHKSFSFSGWMVFQQKIFKEFLYIFLSKHSPLPLTLALEIIIWTNSFTLTK